MRYHRDKRAIATLALARTRHADRFGAVLCSGDGEIRDFVEKGQHRGPATINAGLYVFDDSLLDRVPEGRAASLERDIFPGLIGDRFYGTIHPGYFVDIGTPESCAELQARPQQLLDAIVPTG